MANFEKRIGRDGKPVFRAKVRIAGYPPQSATFTKVSDARKWAASTEAALREGKYFKTSRANTVADLIARYEREILPHKARLTVKYQTQQLAWWRARLGHYRLADLTADLITAQIAALSGGNATIRRYLAVLGHALNIAVKQWQWLDENPMRRVTKPPEPRGRVRFLSDEERVPLLEACRDSRSAHLYTVVVLALSTGARKMELLNLCWGQVDLARGIIHLDATKNGEPRALPINGHALELLQQRQKGAGLVFPGGSGLKPIYIRDAFEAAVKRAGLEDFRFHDLRHSCASYLAMNGASLLEIAEVLGHKDLETTRRYAHLTQAHTRKVLASMNAVMFG